LARRHQHAVVAEWLAVVGVTVEMREITAGHLDPDAVPDGETVARHPGGDGKFVNPILQVPKRE